MSHDKNADVVILNSVCQSAAMGALGIEGLIERAEDESLKKAMYDQLADYQKFESDSKARLQQFDETPEDAGTLKKAMSRMGIRVNTAIDHTSSHLAEMVIQGSTMGITDLQSALNSNRAASEDTQRLCSSLIHKEQFNIDRMKGFLGHKE